MWNVIVNIYFIISGVLFVALQYKSYVGAKRVKKKFGDRPKALGNKGVSGYAVAILKSLVISFIPLLNLLLLYLLIFHEEEIDERVDANVEASIRKVEKDNV